MSKSLALVNGDILVTSGRSFQLVVNRNKLIQDLKLWILEQYGLDPNTPEYGSQLDTYIGTSMSPSVLNEVQDEVLRVLQQYQAMQISNMQRETVQNAGATTLDPSEVISTINGVSVQQAGSMLLVTASVTTLSQDNINLSIPINTNA